MPEPISLQTVRLYVDGELAADDAARLERLLEADSLLRRQVAAEQRLRESIGRSLRASAPADLLGRIQTALAAAPAEAPSPETDAEAPRPQLPGARRSGASRPRSAWHPRRWFVGPQRVNVFAVAACLMLVAGAVLVGIYGRTIDQLRWQQPVDVAGLDLLELAQQEHARSGDAAQTKKECCMHSPAEAVTKLQSMFGPGVEVPDLSAAGFLFDGGKFCRFHDQPLPQLMYRSATGGPRISIFIAKDLGDVDCSSGKLSGCDDAGDHRAWRQDGLVYVMKACLPEALAKAFELVSGESSPAAR